MRALKALSVEAQATLWLIGAQVLYKLVFELEGADIATRSFNLPLREGVYALTAIWVVIALLCLANRRVGYLLGVISGVINLFPLVLLLLGRAPFPHRPYFNGWITASLIYFSYQAYHKLSRGDETQATAQISEGRASSL